ncbi:MAG: molybdopterin-dependent oxidoreductase [Deltaproteobacteria bacterium]|jgi:sulfoxide reductase catalytic subunit YedY|nr:molybdopterin-dependent oxidoreductase [Deltaproteobacteria bacterium]
MNHRRHFIKLFLSGFAGLGLLFSPLAAGIRLAWAKTKKIILPKGTRMENLIGKDPADLDTRNLELTPLEEFETMGLDDHRVNLNTWRLEIDGLVQRPIKLAYSQVIELAPVKRDVLLICPGVFAYHARWQGISVARLLEMAGVNPDATHVIFSGPKGTREKSERFLMEDILAETVFLAYGVNDEVLPRKHGFPLRVVAEGYYGGEWLKYVYKITAHKS